MLSLWFQEYREDLSPDTRIGTSYSWEITDSQSKPNIQKVDSLVLKGNGPKTNKQVKKPKER